MSPLRGLTQSHPIPWACAHGYDISPLRGWENQANYS
jgi:hypothetical protein